MQIQRPTDKGTLARYEFPMDGESRAMSFGRGSSLTEASKSWYCGGRNRGTWCNAPKQSDGSENGKEVFTIL
jgi:hypothetical protein